MTYVAFRTRGPVEVLCVSHEGESELEFCIRIYKLGYRHFYTSDRAQQETWNNALCCAWQRYQARMTKNHDFPTEI